MLYNIAIYLYFLGVVIASLFSRKVRKMWQGERNAINTLKQKVDPTAKYIWFHAASLGEFEQGRPLIEHIKKNYPKYKILLTFFSPSGYEVRKNYEGADIVCYLPLDTLRNAKRFLNAVHPCMVFFIKYEFWYHYLHILKNRNVPTYSISSIFRPNQIFFRWYAKEYKKVLRCFTKFFVQNQQSKDLLASININNVEVVGDTRFDRVLDIRENAKQLPLIDLFKNHKPTFVAGSSWQPDEDVFIKYFNQHNNWKLIIAPHVVDKTHIDAIKNAVKGRVVLYSEISKADVETADCLIIDGYGLLSSIYGYADVTYVGGGFGVGIHNVLEAAVWNVPVIFGPNNKHFIEAQNLIKAKGGFEIASYSDFETIMNQFEQNNQLLKQSGDNAANFVQHFTGATLKIVDSLNKEHSDNNKN